MYLDSDHQFLNLVGKSKANCVVLKFNTRFRDIERQTNENGGPIHFTVTWKVSLTMSPAR